MLRVHFVLNFVKLPVLSLALLLLGAHVLQAGKIIYPWNAANQIVKAGDNLTIWFDTEGGPGIETIELRGPYNSVTLETGIGETGNWVYDDSSGNSYDTQISATVPFLTPQERYDLVIHTSGGEIISPRSVKIIDEYKDVYTIFHISDPHLTGSGFENELPKLLRHFTPIIAVANIINPDMVFVTGDIVNDTQRENFPDIGLNWDRYFRGLREDGHDLSGVYDFNGPVFSFPGNHDYEERGSYPSDKWQGYCGRKSDFWNTYNGLQAYRFVYGESRIMTVNNGWDGCNDMISGQIAAHEEWLTEVGQGQFKIGAWHNIKNDFTELDLNLSLHGHNHNWALPWDNNPDGNVGRLQKHLDQGIQAAFVANSLREHSANFNVYRITEATGEIELINYQHAVPIDENYTLPLDPGIQNLEVTFASANDGSSAENTATLVNKLDFDIPEARVRFVMPLDNYMVDAGEIVQVIKNDSVAIVDVNVSLSANSTVSVMVEPDPNAGVKPLTPTGLPVKIQYSANHIQARFPLVTSSRVRLELYTLTGEKVYQNPAQLMTSGENKIEVPLTGSGLESGGVYLLKLDVWQGSSQEPISKYLRVAVQ